MYVAERSLGDDPVNLVWQLIAVVQPLAVRA